MRSLIALLLILPGASAAPALRPTERMEQEAAVAAIERLGGQVMYDYQRPDPGKPNVFDTKARPTNPEGFHRVVFVSLRDSTVSDNDLKHLAKLTALEALDLTNAPVTGAGLANLHGLRSLKYLILRGTRTDDAGVEHLSGLTRLRTLILDETQISDAALAHLAGLTEMDDFLGLDGTRVTDTGLKQLEKLTKLRNLNLRQTRVTRAGAAKLQESLKAANISVGP
jgi:hypothetical protein